MRRRQSAQFDTAFEEAATLERQRIDREEMGRTCPKCRKPFSSEHGVKIHMARAHV